MEAFHDLRSPQLSALQQQLQAGDQAALATFWARLTSQGTPLIEPYDEQSSLVTLLWRSSEELAAGDLTCAMGGIIDSRKMAQPLLRLAQSDLWYRSYRLPNTVRGTYHFFLRGEPISDPLSQRVLIVPPDPVSVFGNREMRLAIFELPDAAPDPWTSLPANTPRGALRSQRLTSQRLDREYRLSVYTPHGYDPQRGLPYPLLLHFDEWIHTRIVPFTNVLDILIAQGRIPPLVAVLHGHVQREDRMRETAFYEPFFQSIVQEILPWVEQRYAVTHDRSARTIAGPSMGGVAALYAGLRFPELFGNVYSHTGSLHYDQSPAQRCIERRAQQPPIAQRFYLDVGMLERTEMGYGLPDGGPDAVTANRSMRDTLLAHGYDVIYREYPGGHDMLWGAATLAEALTTLLGQQ